MKEAYSAQAMTTLETLDPSCNQVDDDHTCSSSIVHQHPGPTSTAPTCNYLLSKNQPDIHVMITSKQIKEL